ncbi:phBC6A51 family helix-turn-helix protein [Paenibacillus agricola]|uniref:Homeodomain phBC6A51-type domain-containing protein n=1 Tax=Paenibacillus agricola TaxID=2716264 RepID=A0ABX0J6Z1_9BACL|nr:phBC6A51 family helix-turn-helix protein [Paenibacillus agricola]NHN31141.1 hypothetical protein [Paenibacillus agricola]
MSNGTNAKKKALEAKLDGRQIRAALLCVQREFVPEEDGRKSYEEIAAEIGVTRQSLYEWRTQKAPFIEYVNLLADDFLSAERAFVYRQLMKTISGAQPSIKGIDLFFKRHGLITERQIVETKEAGSSGSNADIANELAEIDELLADDSE